MLTMHAYKDVGVRVTQEQLPGSNCQCFVYGRPPGMEEVQKMQEQFSVQIALALYGQASRVISTG